MPSPCRWLTTSNWMAGRKNAATQLQQSLYTCGCEALVVDSALHISSFVWAFFFKKRKRPRGAPTRYLTVGESERAREKERERERQRQRLLFFNRKRPRGAPKQYSTPRLWPVGDRFSECYGSRFSSCLWQAGLMSAMADRFSQCYVVL